MHIQEGAYEKAEELIGQLPEYQAPEPAPAVDFHVYEAEAV